jgi:hypothetical protein
MSTIDDVLNRLADVKRSGGGYIARCPAHENRTPSLSIAESDDDGRLLPPTAPLIPTLEPSPTAATSSSGDLSAAHLSRECATYVGGSASPTPSAGNPTRTPLRAIRAYCLWCCNGKTNEVRLCPSTRCALHEWRLGHRPTEPAKLTPLAAMRARCIDCLGGSQKAPRRCQETECPLHEYRLGHRPKGASDGSLV